MSEPVLYDVSEGVASIVMNRPDAMNALDTELKTALVAVVRRAAADTAVRAVLLTGAGRAFSVGQDLREHARNLTGDVPAVWFTVPEHYNPVAHALATMPKPVIAAVNGIAAGAGAAFAFACDLRIVAESAGFNLAFAAIGLSCDSGSSWTLPRLVGWAKARELLLLPRTVSAAEALEIGLATSVVPDADLPALARELAGQLASGPTLAYAAIRRSLDYSAAHDLVSSLAVEAECMASTGATQDHREAVDAFMRKERPSFRGR